MKKLRYGIILAFATAALLFSGCNPDSPDETGNQNQQTENNSENNNGSSDNQNNNSGNSDNTDNSGSSNNSDSSNKESSSEYNLGLTDLGSGWSSEYDSSTKTISFTDAWAGRGWWLGSFDASAYSSVEIQFEVVSFDIQLVIEYSEGDGVTQYVTAGNTSVSLDLDSSRKSNIKQIYIQNSETGNLTLKKAVLKGSGNTSYSSDDSGNESGNDSGDSSEGDDSNQSEDENLNYDSYVQEEELEAPKGLKVSASSYSTISLSWDDVDNASYYIVFYNITNDVDVSQKKYAYSTSASISGLDNGTIYYFWVCAVSESGKVGNVTAVSGETKAADSYSGSGNESGGNTETEIDLSAPEINSISFTTNEKGLRVTWTGSSYSGIKYNIYRGNSKYSSFKQIASELTSPAYDDTDVDLTTLGNAYFYKIEAVSSTSGKKSEQSDAKGVTMKNPILKTIVLPSQSGTRYYRYGELRVNGVGIDLNSEIGAIGESIIETRYRYFSTTNKKNLPTKKSEWNPIKWVEWENHYVFYPSRQYTINIPKKSISYEPNLELE